MTLSLHARVLLAASLVLAGFLGLTGLALDEAFRDSVETARRERLQRYIYTLLAGSETEQGRLRGPDHPAEPRFNAPGSGLYAEILQKDRKPHWRSASAVGVRIPETQRPETGQSLFEKARLEDGTPLHVLSFGVLWEENRKKPARYVFRVAETLDGFHEEITQFRRSLWGWLGGAATLLLMVQGAILRWGLRPLRRVAADLAEIEAGRVSRLTGPYPPELKGLTDNLNALLEAANSHLSRYRDALGDLAHSLKTPLAVLRAALEKQVLDEESRRSAQVEIERMNRIVSYQLQRAAASGRTHLANPVDVLEKARQIRASLDKVYADKSVDCRIAVSDGALFHGDEGDLLEILGNLMENAYKWCHHHVRLTAVLSIPEETLGQLELRVEDDGPGIPASLARQVLQRGERAGAEVPGHGLGLAIVESIVRTYGGSVAIHKSRLGGADLRVRI